VGNTDKFTAVKVPRQCPLFLLVKVEEMIRRLDSEKEGG
jgi:hypothetical protein